MKYYNIWRLLLVTALCSVGMIVCLMLHAFYNVQYAREIGFGFVLAGLGTLLLMVFKLRRMFRGDMSGFDSSSEKTWRSYR